MSEQAETFLDASADGYGVPDFAAAVDALVAAGLLGEDRAAYWTAEHARLTAAPAATEMPPDPEVERRAVEVLEALAEPVQPRSGDNWDPTLYQRFQDALFALQVVGALSPETAQPWFQRQQQLLEPAGGFPPGPPEVPMPYAADELLDVRIGPDIRQDGMRVTSLELYADCIIVRAHVLIPDEPEDPVERRRYLESALHLDDDLGTTYRAAPTPPPAGACPPTAPRPWPAVATVRIAFTPGAPVSAATFTVTWRDLRFEVR